MRRMTEERVSGQKLVLCCGKRRGCPVIAEEDGGFVLSDVDQTAPGRVVLDREQAAGLVKFLQDQLSR